MNAKSSCVMLGQYRLGLTSRIAPYNGNEMSVTQISPGETVSIHLVFMTSTSS